MEAIKILIDAAIATTLGLIGYYTIAGNKKKMATSKLGKNLSEYEGEKGLKISKKHIIKTERIYENILLIAPPGEGKTTCGIVNNLLGNHLPPCSKVIFDPKGEIYNTVGRYRERLGEYNILYEPLGFEVHYNPLDFCETFTDVRDLAQILLTNAAKGIKDETWINMSLGLLTSALLYAQHCDKPYNTISFALNLLISKDDEKILRLYEETQNIMILEQFAIYCSCLRSDGTAGSIRSTIANGLALFTDPMIKESTKCSDFDFRSLRDRNRTVNIFLKYEISKAHYLSGLLAAFFSQMVEHLIRGYDEKISKKVIIFADELQNIGRIPNLKEYMAYMRYAKIGMLASIQTVSGMYDVYGKYAADSILGCFKTKVIFPSNSDPAMLQMFSSLSGETEVSIEQNQRMQKMKKSLFTGDEIRRLPSHHVLIVCGNQYYLMDKADYYKDNSEYVQNKEGV